VTFLSSRAAGAPLGRRNGRRRAVARLAALQPGCARAPQALRWGGLTGRHPVGCLAALRPCWPHGPQALRRGGAISADAQSRIWPLSGPVVLAPSFPRIPPA